MKLMEVLMRGKALKEDTAQLQFRLTKVAKAQGGATATEGPPALLAAKTGPDDVQSEIMYRGRTAIHGLRRTERDPLEGGLRHVPAIAGSPHSQAPPIPQVGDTGNRNQHT
jgi:hypothetical protein